MMKLMACLSLWVLTTCVILGCSGNNKSDLPAASAVGEATATKNELGASLSSGEPRTETRNEAKEPASVSLRDVGEKKSLEALIASTEPAVVRIDVNTRKGGSIGSGFVIDDSGIVVTNHHVIDGATSAKVAFADGSSLPVAGILGIDPKRDIAILKIQKEGKKLVSLKLRNGRPQKGQAVVAFGAPQGLSFSASEGIVSAIRSASELADFGKPIDGQWIQTTAPISPGNSGGPLVDLFGQVVGINTFGVIKGQNLNFAVSAPEIAQMYDSSKLAIPLPFSIVTDAGGNLNGKEIRSLKIPPKINYWSLHKFHVTTEKSKFDNYRKIVLGPVELDSITTLHLIVLATDDERVLDNGYWQLTSEASNWRFRDNRLLKCLVDGELTSLEAMERTGEVVRRGNIELCVEKLNALVPLSLLVNIARSKNADFAVGKYEHLIDDELKMEIRELLSRLPHTKTTSGIVLESDAQMEAELMESQQRKARQAEDKFRFELVSSNDENTSQPLLKVKLLSPEAKLLSLDKLSDISLKVSEKQEFTVWFFLPNMALTEKPWAIATRANSKARPVTRFVGTEEKKKRK